MRRSSAAVAPEPPGTASSSGPAPDRELVQQTLLMDLWMLLARVSSADEAADAFAGFARLAVGDLDTVEAYTLEGDMLRECGCRSAGQVVPISDGLVGPALMLGTTLNVPPAAADGLCRIIIPLYAAAAERPARPSENGSPARGPSPPPSPQLQQRNGLPPLESHNLPSVSPPGSPLAAPTPVRLHPTPDPPPRTKTSPASRTLASPSHTTSSPPGAALGALVVTRFVPAALGGYRRLSGAGRPSHDRAHGSGGPAWRASVEGFAVHEQQLLSTAAKYVQAAFRRSLAAVQEQQLLYSTECAPPPRPRRPAARRRPAPPPPTPTPTPRPAQVDAA